MRLIIQFSRKMALRLSGFNYKCTKKLMEDPCPVICRVAGHCLALEIVSLIFIFPNDMPAPCICLSVGPSSKMHKFTLQLLIDVQSVSLAA